MEQDIQNGRQTEDPSGRHVQFGKGITAKKCWDSTAAQSQDDILQQHILDATENGQMGSATL